VWHGASVQRKRRPPQRAPARAVAPFAKESADVLTGCRELALERITVALSGMLDKVEDELFTLAEKSKDRDAQNLYLDARSQTRCKRKLLETSFRQFFIDQFNRKVRGESAASSTDPLAESFLSSATMSSRSRSRSRKCRGR
jgi:hypothetical protein